MSKVTRPFCFLILFAMALLQLRFALQEQAVFIGKNDIDQAVASGNARLLNNIAKERHLFEADLDGAVELLQKALLANPWYVPAWLSLAVVKNDLGAKDDSRKILDYANYLTSDIKRWRWDKVLTAYQLGITELLPTELSYIIREIPGKSRRDALQLAFTVWDDPEDLLQSVGMENIIHLLNHASSNNHVSQALFLWSIIDEQGIYFTEQDLLASIDMLIKNNEIGAAGAIWRKEVNSEDLFFNGDFSKPLMQRAFGWRKIKSRSTAEQIEKRSKDNRQNDQFAFHLRFKGWENSNFHHLYQIVPLEGGRSYRLAGHMMSEKLTTDQRPYFEVYGYRCADQFRATAPMVEPDQDWQQFELDFFMPPECRAAVVRLRRNESNQIDSKIAGHLWIKDVSLAEL